MLSHFVRKYFYSPFTWSKNYSVRNLDCKLDGDPEGVLVYMGHSLFNTTKHITLLFIVWSFLHHNQHHIWIKIIQIAIQIEYLQGKKFLDPECNLDCDPDNFAPCKQGIGIRIVGVDIREFQLNIYS